MWWLLWIAVLSIIATMLLIAYLVDRRGPKGMTDRDRSKYRSVGRETGAEPPGYLDAGGGY